MLTGLLTLMSGFFNSFVCASAEVPYSPFLFLLTLQFHALQRMVECIPIELVRQRLSLSHTFRRPGGSLLLPAKACNCRHDINGNINCGHVAKNTSLARCAAICQCRHHWPDGHSPLERAHDSRNEDSAGYHLHLDSIIRNRYYIQNFRLATGWIIYYFLHDVPFRRDRYIRRFFVEGKTKTI